MHTVPSVPMSSLSAEIIRLPNPKASLFVVSCTKAGARPIHLGWMVHQPLTLLQFRPTDHPLTSLHFRRLIIPWHCCIFAFSKSQLLLEAIRLSVPEQ
jgi:hypothetical protein